MKQYVEKKLLNSGARYSETFLAEGDHGKVILKQLHPRHSKNAVEIRRFLREGMLRPVLKHTITAAELITEDNEAWIVRPYFEGKDLKTLAAGLTTDQKWRVVKGIHLALQELHNAEILHLDLKPSNVLISEDFSEIKLIDLGLAYPTTKRVKEAEGYNKSFWTLPGMLYPFSFYYAPPEQMLNCNDLFCSASDFFSLGIIVYELFAGEKPYSGAHPALLTNMMINYPVDVLKIKDQGARELVKALTAKHVFSKPPNLLTKAQQKYGLRKGIEMRRLAAESAVRSWL
ncbi:MAG: protein kinase [Bacteroidia bacterium]|nr:protein kinase [Bacteroidia bacterium]